MKYLLLLLMTCSSNLLYADDNLPASCQPLVVQGETIKLSAKQPMVILIHSLAEGDLWLNHPIADVGASAGWSSQLNAGNWTALALNKEDFELSCIESKPGHEQQVPCEGMLAACEWPTVRMPAQLKGTFWAGENMTLPALLVHLGGRGFGLPASAK